MAFLLNKVLYYFVRKNTYIKRTSHLLVIKDSFSKSLSTVRKQNIMNFTTNANKSSNSLTDDRQPTAGIIIIGDEILNGQTLDSNTNFLTKGLYKLGVRVLKVSIVPDDIHVISAEVKLFSNQFTFVITSGGIGPTHDDITFEGVAKAFDDTLIYHPEILKLLKQWFKTEELTTAASKMAKIPSSAELIYGEDKAEGKKSIYPTIRVQNVTIYPGIPHLQQRSFGLLGKQLYGSDSGGFFSDFVYLTCTEVEIAAKLNEVVAKFPNVKFGSYPKLFHSYYRTRITMESSSNEETAIARKMLIETLDSAQIIDYVEDTISNPWPYIDSLININKRLKMVVDESFSVLDQCLKQYSLDETIICYNGGKDCLLALHLFYAFVSKNYPGQNLQAVYITEENSFVEIDKFVEQTINRYNLNCEYIPGPMKPALQNLLARKPLVKAVIIGTRRIDPHGNNSEFFEQTDGDWPKMMRVSPILNWEYHDVWDFIRGLFLPYCSLYDRGYTSLGSQKNTNPNGNLKSTDGFGRVIYDPAYKLKDSKFERNGRI